MDASFRRSMKPANESSRVPLAAAAVSSSSVGGKLSAILSACADGDASLRQTAHSHLVDWVRSCPVETVGVILETLLLQYETPSSLHVPARTMLELIIRDCPSINDMITDCLLSRLTLINDTAQSRIVDLLAESMRVCPDSVNKIIQEVFRRFEIFGASKIESPLTALLKEASEEVTQRALDALLNRCNSCFPGLRSLAAAHLALFAKVRPEKREAVALALFSSCNDPSVEVRSAAINSLESIFELIRDRASEIIEKLIDLCDDEDSFLRRAVIKQLHRYINFCPEKTKEIYAKACLLCRDEDCTMRERARELLMKFVDFWPQKADEVASVLLETYHDNSSLEKTDVLHLIEELMRRCSRQQCEEIADLFIQCCRIDGRHPDERALRRMGKVIKMCPARAEEIAEIVLHWSKQQHQKGWFPVRHDYIQRSSLMMVRQLRDVGLLEIVFTSASANAVSQLGHVAEACPGRAEEILALVLSSCEHEDKELQRAAISQLGLMAKVSPDKSEQIANVVLRFLDDDSWDTRVVAVCQLSELAAVLKENKEPVVTALIRTCNDRHCDVRTSAITQLPRAMKSCPDMSWKIFTMLLKKCASENATEKSVAKTQLEKAFMACPDVAIDALETLRRHRPAKTRRLT